MKKVIATVLGILLFIFLLFFIVEMTSEEETYRIGVLMTGENRLNKLDGLKDGLIDLSYDLKEFEFVVREASDDADRLNDLASQLLEENLDLIVAFGAIEAQTLQNVMAEKNKYKPVVFIGIAAPKEIGLIEDYRRPGGHFTGINNYHSSLSPKRLELFHELIPGMEKIGVIYSHNIEISNMSMDMTKKAAEQLDIDIIPIDISSEKGIEALEDVAPDVDGLLSLPSFQVESYAEEIVSIANEAKIPAMGIYDHEVDMGYLVSYGSSFYEQGYQGARHVSHIIQGNDPGDIPVEVPDKMVFFINKPVSEELGIHMNEDLLELVQFVEGGESP